MAIEVLDVQYTKKMEEERVKQDSTIPIHIKVDGDVVYFDVSDKEVPIFGQPGLAKMVKGGRYVIPKSEIRDLLGSL